MRSLWIDYVVRVDTDRVQLLHPSGTTESVMHENAPARALAELLAQVAAPRGRAERWRRRLHVLLGSPWYHAALLQWQDGLYTDEAWSAYGRAVLNADGVPSAAGLDVSVEGAGFEKSRLCVAIHQRLMVQLQGAAQAAGWKIASCRDILSVLIARHLKVLPKDCMFAVLEQDMLTCVTRREGAWSDLAMICRAPGQTIADALVTARLLGADPQGAKIFLVATTRQAREPSDDWEWLDAGLNIAGGIEQ